VNTTAKPTTVRWCSWESIDLLSARTQWHSSSSAGRHVSQQKPTEHRSGHTSAVNTRKLSSGNAGSLCSPMPLRVS